MIDLPVTAPVEPTSTVMRDSAEGATGSDAFAEILAEIEARASSRAGTPNPRATAELAAAPSDLPPNFDHDFGDHSEFFVDFENAEVTIPEDRECDTYPIPAPRPLSGQASQVAHQAGGHATAEAQLLNSDGEQTQAETRVSIAAQPSAKATDLSSFDAEPSSTTKSIYPMPATDTTAPAVGTRTNPPVVSPIPPTTLPRMEDGSVGLEATEPNSSAEIAPPTPATSITTSSSSMTNGPAVTQAPTVIQGPTETPAPAETQAGDPRLPADANLTSAGRSAIDAASVANNEAQTKPDDPIIDRLAAPSFESGREPSPATTAPRPIPTTVAQRIDRWITSLDRPATTTSMVLELDTTGDFRVTVAVRASGLQVAVTGATSDDVPWIQDLTTSLESRGIEADVSSDAEPDEQQTSGRDDTSDLPNPTPRPRRPADKGLRL